MNANSQKPTAGCTAVSPSELAAVAGGQSATITDFLAGFVAPFDELGRVITHTDAVRSVGKGL